MLWVVHIFIVMLVVAAEASFLRKMVNNDKVFLNIFQKKKSLEICCFFLRKSLPFSSFFFGLNPIKTLPVFWLERKVLQSLFPRDGKFNTLCIEFFIAWCFFHLSCIRFQPDQVNLQNMLDADVLSDETFPESIQI